MVGEKAEGRVALEGGVSASNGAEFGRMWWTVAEGIFRREESWVPVGFQVDSGEMWVVSGVERRGRVAEGLGEIGG